MIEDLRVRNYSPRTIDTYVRCVAAFAAHFGRSPADLDREHVRRWQVHLVEEKKASASAINQHAAALRFLYSTTLKRKVAVEEIPYARRPKKLPVVPSASEVGEFLAAVENLKHRTVLLVIYAAGLRLVEIDGEHVRFLWKDRAHGGKSRCMRVAGVEFVRRFLLHVLPKGFVRIRHFGFLSNRAREKKLALARRLIADRVADPQAQAKDVPRSDVVVEPCREAQDRCPSCELGRMKPAGAIESSPAHVPDT
jgi:site-specific recombinase XerD